MSDSETVGGAGDSLVPPERYLIREDNWAEYKALGFGPIRVDSLEEAQALFGTENVCIGDAWDEEAGWPLRDKPGKGFYANGEAIDAYIDAQFEARREARRQERASVGLRWGRRLLHLIRRD